MNKKQFLAILRDQLSPLGETERRELLQDFEEHFTTGLGMGKTEEEIALDLGDPIDLAQEILGERFEYVNMSPPHVQGRASTPKFLLFISLVFFNLLLAFPFGLAAWAICFSLGIASLTLLASPIMLVADILFNQSFALSKVFMVMLCLGLGIFMGLGVQFMWHALKKATKQYISWNLKMMGDK